MTQTVLVAMGAFAVLASAGLLLDVDKGTRVFLGFLGALVWGFVGLSAFNVHAEAYSGTEAIYPLAYLGLGMAAIVGMVTIWQLLKATGEEAGATGEAKLLE